MSSEASSQEKAARFDDRLVEWRSLGMAGFVASIFHVDPVNNVVEFIIKFDPNSNSLAHRHLALTHTFVIEGDHVIYEPDGVIRESRPAGRYSVSNVTGDVHSEGGGPNGCTLLYSVRGDSDELFDMLDDNFKSIGILRIADFQHFLGSQNNPA